MKVLKFGGTSVGTVVSLANVKKVVEAQTCPVIVVVSALGGVTDLLIKAASLAADDKPDECDETVRLIAGRHHDVIAGLVPPAQHDDVAQLTDTLLQNLKSTLVMVRQMRTITPQLQCRVVSFGETLSSLIISSIITGAKFFDSFQFIKTRPDASGANVADLDTCAGLIADAFSGFSGPVAVAPGFVATDAATGEITNLGRGGSDYTAAIIAAGLNASSLEIWTDVDGFMTADPRKDPSATVMPHISYAKASRMCQAGAKVIYYPTIRPVELKQIPIWVKNTFNPDAPGTLIDAAGD